MKIKKATLHIQIADALREMIMIGDLKHGDKINENDLCASMEISKTPPAGSPPGSQRREPDLARPQPWRLCDEAVYR